MSSTRKNNKTQFTANPTGASNRTGIGKTSRKSMAPASIDSQSKVRKSIYGGASRTVLSSSSKKNVQMGLDKIGSTLKPVVQVLDESGRDVTPLPLTHVDPAAVRQKQSNILADSSVGTPTDLMSQVSIYQTGTVTASTFGGGPFTRSVFSASQSGRSTGSITDDIGEPAGDIGSAWADTQVQYKREDVVEELSEADLEKTVDINLSETETIWLLDIAGVCVSLESEDAVFVREQNERYKELTVSRVGNDRYVERGMTTFNEPPKVKSVQTTKVTHSDMGVNASNWDMHDTYELVAQLEAIAKQEAAEEEEQGTVSRPISVAHLDEKKDAEKDEAQKEGDADDGNREEQKTSQQKSVLDADATKKGSTARSMLVSVAKIGDSQGTMMSSFMGGGEGAVPREGGAAAEEGQDMTRQEVIMKSEELRRDLVIMERAVNLNTYQPRQAQYRGYPTVPDVDKKEPEETPKKRKAAGQMALADLGPNLDRLWAFQSPLCKGRNVSCMAWNKTNPDLLAVGYGQFEFTNQKGGLVCCWSLKNPECPERVYTTENGVTALDFSLAHPNLLSMGLYDGTVAIYNVKGRENDTVLDSLKDIRPVENDEEASGKHTGPVWQLRWIEKERGSGEERSEVLVSVSTDGRITQWSIRKGFESYDLMKLKRIAPRQGHGKTKKAEAFISRFAGGMCFDFSVKDSNIYLAGTEEGHIHKCSCSYNEQYLDSYFGHTGPVYRIHWSPFTPDVFLSCSGDWSIRLWHQDRLKPVLTFHSSTKSVLDVCWSPRCATVFACVNEGAVEVWDLSQSTLDPVIVHAPGSGVKMSSVAFSRNSECLLVGDSDGHVTVHNLRAMPDPPESQGESLMKLIQSSLASQLQGK